jgi:hypothetical protein
MSASSLYSRRYPGSNRQQLQLFHNATNSRLYSRGRCHILMHPFPLTYRQPRLAPWTYIRGILLWHSSWTIRLSSGAGNVCGYPMIMSSSMPFHRPRSVHRSLQNPRKIMSTSLPFHAPRISSAATRSYIHQVHLSHIPSTPATRP